MKELDDKSRTITDDEAGIRLDRWFKRHFPDLTNGQVQKLCRTGQIRVAGKRAETSTRVEAGQIIRIPPSVVVAPEARSALRSERDEARLKDLILFEDDDVLALNKPSGLAVQGGTGLKENLDDMLDALRNAAGDKPKLVHRLDRDTSGVLLLAKNAYAATRLAESFRARDTKKVYWALTTGVPEPRRGKLSAPLIKRGDMVFVDHDRDPDAKEAVTYYQTIEEVKGVAAFVALWPITGRTHQLRVHMQYIGTPIAGDRMYTSENPNALPVEEMGRGLHLHARQLILPHPRRGLIDIEAPLGGEMRKTWKWFGFDANAPVQSEMD